MQELPRFFVAALFDDLIYAQSAEAYISTEISQQGVCVY